MAKSRIRKTVYDKDNFDKVIDRSFNSYLQEDDTPEAMSI